MRNLILSFVTILAFTSVCSSQWVRQPFPSNENLTKVRFINSHTGWVLTGKSLYKTSDGGISWVMQDTAMKWGMWSLSPLDTLTAFHSFSLDSLNSPFLGIRKTTDGGNTWFTVDSAKNFYYSRIRFTDPLTGFTAGDSLGVPVIRKTSDGGNSWRSIYKVSRHDNPPVADYFSGLYFITPSLGWGVTYLGFVVHTSDGGATWKIQDTLASVPRGNNEVIEDVQFASRDTGWSVGGLRGTSLIYRTTNGGKTWESLSPDRGSSLQELAVIDSKTVYIVGRNYGVNNIAKTTDAGLTWEFQQLTPEGSSGLLFNSISMIDRDTGWFVGDNGEIYKTVNGGTSATLVSDNISKHLNPELKQNYPNPFNPSTKIEYLIPQQSRVILKVYDMLGREILTLVNSIQQPGRYSVMFDAGGLASGVYLYRIQAGNFSDAKKLLLVR